MEVLNMSSLVARVAQASGKWAMYVNLGEFATVEDVVLARNALPWLTSDDDQCLMDGFAVVLFDSRKEAYAVYEAVPGDDNPPAEGLPRFYAMLASPELGVVTENT